MAVDEFLKHGNRFFSNFPMPKSLASFIGQSIYIGPGLACRRRVDLWYSSSWKEDVPRDYQSSVPPTMTREKRLIYEVFLLLKTHVVDRRRNDYPINYVTSVKDKISVELRRKVLEDAIAANPPTSADDILKSLAQVYEESIQREVDEQDTEEGNDVTTASLKSTHTSSRKIKKRTKHPKMHEDIFAAGRELLIKKDHLAVRSNAQRRRAKKGALRRCILNSITDRQRRVVIAAVGMEVATRPAWQQRLRSCENNLKLT